MIPFPPVARRLSKSSKKTSSIPEKARRPK